MPVKLLIFLAVWKRPEITEICFMGINRLRKSGLFPIEAFAVISEDSMIPLCEKYDIDYRMYKNEPLGEKKNYGLSVAMDKDFDYLIEIGSDDLIKTELLELYAPYFGHKHLLGCNDFVCINSEDLECRRIHTNKTPYGAGRAISKEALSKIGTLWPWKAMQGMDKSSHFTLVRSGFTDTRVGNGPLVIDIKSDVNIWPFNYLEGTKIEFSEAVKGISTEEIEAIKSLYVAA